MSRTQYAPISRTLLPEIPLHSIVFTAFDFETTGLDYKKDRITEIGAVKFTLDNFISEYETLINPQLKISEEVTRITGITNTMCENMPLIAEKIPDLFDFFSDTWLIAHNALFDASFLRQACIAEGAPLPANIVLDTRLITRSVFPGLPGYGLDRLTAYLKISSPRHHRALDDAKSCMHIFLECVKKRGTEKTANSLYPTGLLLNR